MTPNLEHAFIRVTKMPCFGLYGLQLDLFESKCQTKHQHAVKCETRFFSGRAVFRLKSRSF